MSLAANGYRFATLKSLFSSSASETTWVKAVSDGAPLVGFLMLARVATGEFTDIPADPVVPANKVGQALEVRLATASAGVRQLISQVRLEPVPGVGIRVGWPDEIDATVRGLAAGRIRQGDVVTAVEGVPVSTLLDAWNLYRRFKSKETVSVRLRRSNGEALTVNLRNPLITEARE